MRAERELLEAFVKGDMHAMEQVVDTYKDDVYNLCFRLTYSRHDADELFQDTWLNVIKGAAGFADGSFKNWVYTICLNRYRDRCRRESRRRSIVADNYRNAETKEHAMSLLVSDANTEKTVEEKFVSSMLMSKIEMLDEKFKTPIKLFYFENLRYSDISQICSIPEGTVKSRINTAKSKLKKMMESELS